MPKRLLYIGLMIGLLCSSLPLCATLPSGNCGDRKPDAEGKVYSDSANVTWTLYTDSVAFVGEGAMGTTGSVSSSYRSSVKKVFFSKDITFIGRYTLSYMNNLEQITVDPENANYYSPEGSNCLIERANEYDTNIMLGIGNGYIPEGVEVMRNYALCDNYRLTSITIPRSVRQMGETTPQQGVGYDETPFQLPTLTEIHVQWTSEEELPVWISKKKINNADKIKLYVPCGTKSIYKNAEPWKTCKDIVEEGCCEIAGGECGFDETDDVHWSLDACGTLTISGTGRMKNWSNEVSAEKPGWYKYREDILSVVVEEDVTSLGGMAFYECTKLNSVNIPNTVTKIWNMAFYNCISLTSVSIPNSVIYIGGSAFSGCETLTSVNIPNYVTFLGMNVFKGCKALTSISIPNSITEIPFRTFYECTALSSVELPESVTTIDLEAFKNCTSLPFVTIPSNVTTIGWDAFEDCTALSDLYVSWTEAEKIPEWKSMTNNSGITLHVPCAGIEAYREAEGWKNYTIEGDGTYEVSVDVNDPTMGSVKIEIIEE